MFVFDQLKREDPALRLMSLVFLAGLTVLLGGLWWVQVVKAREYQSSLETQSLRSIRTPAPRGKIMDRTGLALAENRPRYNISLYLEELRKPFDREYATNATAARAYLRSLREAREKQLGRKLTKEEAKPYLLTWDQRTEIRNTARYTVANRVANELSVRLQMPVTIDPAKFKRHYFTSPYQPFPVLTDVPPLTMARFEEQFSGIPGVDLELQSLRGYPFQSAAAHLLGYLRRDNSSVEGEEAYFSYRLPDYRGVVGLEGGLDEELRGRAGAKSILVNNLGYRQSENVWQPAVPGYNTVLTIDLRLQQAAEQALRSGGANTRGAAVVLDTRNGDVLALASLPAFNPNHWVNGFTAAEWARVNDEDLKPQINRVTYGIYQPGSIFKIVVGMAALENGLNPETLITVPPHPDNPNKGIARYGRNQSKMDQAAPGQYNFRRAFAKSSNKYFIDCGLETGVEKIVEMGRKLHLGEPCRLPMSPESKGHFPTLDQLRSGWSIGATANLCIGQESVYVTPMQVAVMMAAIANGGTVYWPRLVQRLEPQDPLSSEPPVHYEAGRVREQLNLKRSTLRVMQDAMLDDTAPDGTGAAAGGIPGFRVGGKTGTAQIGMSRNRIMDHSTWFASYGPWENPRYAVVVMIESGQSGGGTCAPIARDIYEAIHKFEREPQPLAARN